MIFRDRENWFIAMVAAIFLFAIIVGGITIKDSIECGNKGGLYLTGKSMFPVCLKAEVIK